MNTGIQKFSDGFTVFTLPENNAKIELIFADEMFWLSQKMIANLFETTVSNVNKHLSNILQSADLQKKRTIEYFSIVQKEGNRDVQRMVAFYHLDVVVAVGLRINNQRATRFKQWAAQKLREYVLTIKNKPSPQLPATTPYSQDISVGDALIHCRIAGRESAPALVWLHGNGEDLHIFDPQIQYFSQHYRVIAIDTRGHGQSTRGTAPFHFYTFAADLIAVFDALQIGQAHIVGFSDGAITAMHLALTAPERILSMVLLGANYNAKGLTCIVRLQILTVYACLSVASLFSAKMRTRKEIWGLMVCYPNLTVGEIKRITVPTLIVTGEKDMVSQRQNDEISRAIAGSKRLIIPAGDHFWMLKNPETLNRCVMDFLTNFNESQYP